MKIIRELKTPTSGLAAYLNAVSNDANWDEFRSHNSGASYHELRDALTHSQHGLCAYCEMVIDEWCRQVEHVIPQSDDGLGKVKALDIANMVACCKGGTVHNDDEDHYRRPVRHNMSCGQAKGNQIDENFIDPRTLPALPSLVRAERLRLQREKRWNGLEEESGQIDDPDNPDMMNTWIRSVLTPDENDRLDPFFTTTRSYFAPLGESILAEEPQKWI